MNPFKRRKSTSPLTNTKLDVVITDLLAEYTLRHTFRNEGKEAIEAVYSFPVPLDAAFCGMDATLAGETRTAVVGPATQANREYDQAIGEGNSAVLLELLEPGLLCVNLGNLKPDEEGEVVLRFAAALGVADGTARFSLPLAYRPRYGRSQLDDLVQPSHDFAVEHPMAAHIRVRGLLARRPVQCSLPGTTFASDGEDLTLQVPRAMLDRDVVLAFDMGHEPLAQARWVKDGEGSLGILSFSLPVPPPSEQAPLDVCLLMDCSGSMSGDAIVQSRAALNAVAGALGDQDRVQVIRFGSSMQPMLRRPMSATDRVRGALDEVAQVLAADLGGTEMAAALEAGLDSLESVEGPHDRKVVILVTDGAMHAYALRDVTTRATELGIRVFVVAVGSSAGVEALAPLASATHGALERAVPAEPIDQGVMRHLRRARSTPVAIDVTWGDGKVQPLPVPAAYWGDAVTAIAAIEDQQLRQVAVRITGRAQPLNFVVDGLRDWNAARAWAGQQIHARADAAEQEAVALRYSLITEQTKAILVKVREADDKVEGLPVIERIAHMVPHGMLCEDFSPLDDVRLSMRSMVDSAAPPAVYCMDLVVARPQRPVRVVEYRTDTSGRPIVPKGYRPSEDEEYMNPLMLEYFRQRLLAWRAELIAEAAQLLTTLDGAAAKRAQERYNRVISKIDSTIKRVESGDYGYCVDTGEVIGIERLEASPIAERTLEAQERFENLRARTGP